MSRKTLNPRTKEISAEKLAELKYNARGILAEIRRAVLDRYPFFGTIALNMELVPIRDSRVSTAATDGKNIYFDIDFLASLNNNDRIFVFAHEIVHNVMMHFLRNEGRDRKLWNIATDMEVNEILKSDGLVCPKDGLTPATYYLPTGHSAEEYYQMLQQQSNAQQQSGHGNGGGSSGSQSDSGDSDSNDSNGNSDSKQKPKNNPDQQSGDKDGDITKQFDKHIYEGDSADDDSDDPNTEDRYGKVGHDNDYNPHFDENTVQQMREMTISAAQEVERQGRGEVPAKIKELINKMLTPKVDWREKLASFVSKTVGDRACWAKPNRRFIASRTYLPSHDGEKIKIGVILDTSGSTIDDMSQFLGEANSIVKTFGNYELTIIQCDAEVQNVATYNEDNPLDLENTKFERYGNGGTYLKPAFEEIRDSQLDIDAVVVFTDGDIDTITPDYCDLPALWILSKGGTKRHIQFGDIVEFDNGDSTQK